MPGLKSEVVRKSCNLTAQTHGEKEGMKALRRYFHDIRTSRTHTRSPLQPLHPQHTGIVSSTAVRDQFYTLVWGLVVCVLPVFRMVDARARGQGHEGIVTATSQVQLILPQRVHTP